MFRVRSERDGRPIIILGITEVDIKRLMKGQPTLIEGEQARRLGLKGRDLMICYGEDLEPAQLDQYGVSAPGSIAAVAREPRPFTVRCRSCGLERLNTQDLCACGSASASFSPHDAARYEHETEEQEPNGVISGT